MEGQQKINMYCTVNNNNNNNKDNHLFAKARNYVYKQKQDKLPNWQISPHIADTFWSYSLQAVAITECSYIVGTESWKSI